MDLAEDKNQGSGSPDRSTGSNPESDLNQPRSCADCKTTKTPLWRAGSNGPKGSGSGSRSEDGSGSGSSDRSSGSNPESDRDGPRGCTNCKATKTPLWRVGPTGPKSLCNACGIRYQKKMAALAPKVGAKMKNSAKIFRLIGSPSQMRAVMLNLKQGVLREEEEAAVLLMALSSGILCSAQN